MRDCDRGDSPKSHDEREILECLLTAGAFVLLPRILSRVTVHAEARFHCDRALSCHIPKWAV
jgi:hypothetical protein